MPATTRALKYHARLLRHAYVELRRTYSAGRGRDRPYTPNPAWDGRRTANPRKPDQPNMWEQTAAKLLAQGIDPAGYVEALHDAIVSQFPQPPQLPELLSPRLMAMYQAYRRDLPARVAQRLRSDANTARTEIVLRNAYGGYSMENATWLTLTNGVLSISPLFRYCMAMGESAPRFHQLAAQRFEQAAVLQYMRAREEYARAWEDVLPAGFDTRAQEVYDRLIR